MYRSCRWAAALLLVVAAGCGQVLPPETDAGVARAALVAALDAWKAGETPESLEGRSPPVYIQDGAWARGAALESYEVTVEGRSGLSVRFEVALVLRQEDGEERERVARYIVDAAQAVVIRPEQ